MGDLWPGILISSMVLAAFLVVLLIIYYIVSYLGLKKRRAFVKELQENIKPGVKVLFSGGLMGRVIKVNEEYVDIELNKGMVITVSRYGIQEIVQ